MPVDFLANAKPVTAQSDFLANATPVSQVAGLPAGVDLPGLADHAPINMQAPFLSRDATPTASTDFAKGIVKGGLNTVNGVSSLIHSIPGIGETLVPSSGLTADKLYAQPVNTAQKVGKGVEQAAEFMLPGAAEETTAAKLLPYAGKLGETAAPLLKTGLAAIGSGSVNALQGGSFGTGALMGGIGSGVAQGVQAMAPALAESALKVTGNDKIYGRTVGKAILDDTQGIRPSTVEQSARNTIGQLTPQVEQMAADAGANGSRGSLLPARDAVAQTASKHTLNRAVNSATELDPLQNFLKTDAVTGLPLSANQSPTGLLQMKRGVDADFIGNWNPNRNSNNELDAAKQAYGKLADQFHAAAPGTQELDQRVSSLIPVIDRSNRAARGAGILESTMNRFRAPTGALTGAVAGGVSGYEHGHSLPEALVGAGIGAVAPSLIAAPETQMALARMAYAAPRYAPAFTGAALQAPKLYPKP